MRKRRLLQRWGGELLKGRQTGKGNESRSGSLEESSTRLFVSTLLDSLASHIIFTRQCIGITLTLAMMLVVLPEAPLLRGEVAMEVHRQLQLGNSSSSLDRRRRLQPDRTIPFPAFSPTIPPQTRILLDHRLSRMGPREWTLVQPACRHRRLALRIRLLAIPIPLLVLRFTSILQYQPQTKDRRYTSPPPL